MKEFGDKLCQLALENPDLEFRFRFDGRAVQMSLRNWRGTPASSTVHVDATAYKDMAIDAIEIELDRMIDQYRGNSGVLS